MSNLAHLNLSPTALAPGPRVAPRTRRKSSSRPSTRPSSPSISAIGGLNELDRPIQNLLTPPTLQRNLKSPGLELKTPAPDLHSAPSLGLIRQDATTMMAMAALGFSLVAADLVFWHTFAPVDATVHTWVSSTLPADFRSLIAGGMLSNSPILAGWCGWVLSAIAAAALCDGKHHRALRHVAIAAAVYAFGGGSIRHGDPFLVDALKHAFMRVRPSPVHSTFAFPSGHTTAVTFITGTLLFILLPAVVEAACRRFPGAEGAVREVSGKVAPFRVGLWVAFVLMTGTGRILADAHWTSDVMAGACLGSALVGAAALLCLGSDRLASGPDGDGDMKLNKLE